MWKNKAQTDSKVCRSTSKKIRSKLSMQKSPFIVWWESVSKDRKEPSQLEQNQFRTFPKEERALQVWHPAEGSEKPFFIGIHIC